LSFFATSYTIHFDDTMAYGSHHFLTAFKFQCEARETLLFGDRVFDLEGVREALSQVHLFTSDAYARNLSPAQLGDRVAILLTLEDWGKISARFCYRVINDTDVPICAGFQTVICADAATGRPVPLPMALQQAMEAVRMIEEPAGPQSFRERVLAGGSYVESLFTEAERQAAREFLAQRYPIPQIVPRNSSDAFRSEKSCHNHTTLSMERSPEAKAQELGVEAWIFAGQGAFDAQLLSDRVAAYRQQNAHANATLRHCINITKSNTDGDIERLLTGNAPSAADVVRQSPALAQVAIHIQNVLGAELRRAQGYAPRFVMGHSFGELAAFNVAGCFDLPTGVQMVCDRIAAIDQCAPPGGGLIAVATSREHVIAEIAALELVEVVVAGRNHAEQSIVSGPLTQLRRLSDRMQAINVGVAPIPSPTAFHHPSLKTATSAWLQNLRKLSLRPPQLELYSPTCRRFIQSDDDIAQVLVSQLVRPFDWERAVRELSQAGVTRFVDCGSTGYLARLAERAGTPELPVSTMVASPSRNGKSNPVVSSPHPISSEGTAPSAAPVDHSPHPPIAIVAQGCILPAGAKSPSELYQVIQRQRSGIVDIRKYDSTWSKDFYSETLEADRSTSHLTGRVEDIDITVPDGVEPDVFRRFSRAQRLLCIALAPCVAAIRDAERIVCLIGATADGFEDQDDAMSLRVAGLDPADSEVDRLFHSAHAANQEPHDAVQEVFDHLVRPGIQVTLLDAACASSLYTVALGVRSLELGLSDAVIAGGVFCPGPGNSCLFSQFRGTTSTGCRPFDANSDGVVFSEGAALVTMRRLADAEHQGLPIAAVVRGVGLSSDGRSTSANVPQVHGQILSLQRCYREYGIDPSSIDAIEGHGTSTPVGDATELETLRQFFAEYTDRPIPIHSLKGLLGHAGWAAGTASVIAVCEYLRVRLFPQQACFKQPSTALVNAADTLFVPRSPVALSDQRVRVAIDGFGFGGANAHLVLESYVPKQNRNGQPQTSLTLRDAQDDELVFVAFDEMVPTNKTPSGARFDRAAVSFPAGHVVLPDLWDDMDISQKLAVALVDRMAKQLLANDEALRRDTSVILVQSGKTERGVEATLRVQSRRLLRRCNDRADFQDRIVEAANRFRPSGPYTLQCMMPNVAAGRAALQLNLNGPNFVVDAGNESLEAACEVAELLLRNPQLSGTSLVIMPVISANPWQMALRGGDLRQDEFALVFALTTARIAHQKGWATLGNATEIIRAASANEVARSSDTQLKSREVLQQLSGNRRETGTSRVDASTAETSAGRPVRTSVTHTPIWVERALPSSSTDPDMAGKNVLFLIQDDEAHVRELIDAVPVICADYRIAIAGHAAGSVAERVRHPLVIAVDGATPQRDAIAAANLLEFRPHIVVAVQPVADWEVRRVARDVATRTELCELMFCIASQGASRLRRGEMELWGLWPGGWNGTVHPASGAIAGLLKSIHREISAARVGSVCTSGGTIAGALHLLVEERARGDGELEVAYDNQRRLVRRLRPIAASGSRALDLTPNSVVVATGGARGVTAVMIEALLRDSGCTVVCIGRSQLEPGPDALSDPEAEADFYRDYLEKHPGTSAAQMRRAYECQWARWEAHHTVERLKQLAGRTEYLQLDVTDADQVRGAVRDIVHRYGRIDLILHGAGIQISKRLEDRSLDEFRETYGVKVCGLSFLLDACHAELPSPPAVHVLTSAYSIFGNDGQHDYGAANETLDRLCGLTEISGDRPWSSVAWLAWDGIGMTRGSEYTALAKRRGLSGMTVEEGQEIFREVVMRGTENAIHVPLTSSEHVAYQLRTIPPPVSDKGDRLVEVPIVLKDAKWLTYHRVRKIPTLPGAWILEQMVHAALQHTPAARAAQHVIIEQAEFSRFVRHKADQEPNLRLVLEQIDQVWHAWLLGNIIHSSGAVLSRDEIFAQAQLQFSHDTQLGGPKIQHLRADADTLRTCLLRDPYCRPDNTDVCLSGPFDCLRGIRTGPDGRYAKFMPSPTYNGEALVPALLIDAAWRLSAMYAPDAPDELFVPVRFRRLTVPLRSGRLPSPQPGWEICAKQPRVDDRDVYLQRTEVCDAEGRIVLEIDDALARRIN
jgi:3-oxoacyl-(acyl-carrier-protein) synthase/NAD(P)-dependent dehydrogenase (short-subunit alcohol dehydrogenase family)/acyl-CoA thioesterase FadM